MTDYVLTKEHRRTVCVHEAAHAVVFALGGLELYRVAVAPEGAKSWQSKSRKGYAQTDLWGVCEVHATHPAAIFMQWDGWEDLVVVDRKGFRQYLGMLEARRKGIRREAWREVRARLCATLAGPISEQLINHVEPEIDYEGQPGVLDDAKHAMAADCLLPWRNEFEAMHALTVETLRRPEVWALVILLAEELGRRGEVLDDIEQYLPAPVANWPPSPKAKSAPPFIVKALASVTAAT